MKRKLILFVALAVSAYAYAQQPSGAPQGQRPPMPEGFQPGQMPEGFQPGQMPEGFQPAPFPPGLEYMAQMTNMTPVEKATFLSDKMRDEVKLSDKQYKKVFALFKRDFKHRDYLDNGGGGMSMGGFPGGGPMGPPPMMMGGFTSGLTDEYFHQQDEKLQKILTPEQHKQWRAAHPVESAAKSSGDNGFPFPGGFPGGGPGGFPGGFPGGGPGGF